MLSISEKGLSCCMILTALLAPCLHAQQGTPGFAFDQQAITDCRNGLGRATLRWQNAAGPVEIRVNSPDGPLMTAREPASGEATTGYWITNSMQFLLIDDSGKVVGRAVASLACTSLHPDIAPVLKGVSYFPLQIGNEWIYRVNDRRVTSAYQAWRINRTQEYNGHTWFVVTMTGPANVSGENAVAETSFRVDESGRVHTLTSATGGFVENLWLDPTPSSSAAALLAIRDRLPGVETSLGTLDDGITYRRVNPPTESGIFVRGVGLVAQTSTLLAGSSGGFFSGLELVEARIYGGAVVLKSPLPSWELGIERLTLNVTGKQVKNCAVPCYFTACSFTPSDPPNTYKPCAAARLHATGYSSAESITVSLKNSSGTTVFTKSVAVDPKAAEFTLFEQIPLYSAPNVPLLPGRYELTGVLNSQAAAAGTSLKIELR
ncbi:MAG: hypothetical protein H7Y20_06980 [Bryobacteraceae bacterium]|nr:hypothetical protein [Bryobacteraceae bacterium]